MTDLHAFKAGAKNWIRSASLAAVVAMAAAFATPAQASSHVVLDATLNERVVMVPAISGGQRIQLETTIFTPPGNGPFPVLIMNHGKAMGSPRAQNRDRFLVVSREFVRRGYAVVVPMRKGFSKSTGDYADRGCNMTANGHIQAEDLFGTLNYLRGQSWADANRVVVAGQSYGGLTTMAFGTRNYPGVRGLINFAGGLKVHGGTCRWQDSLVQAFHSYGARSSVPSLWFYGENDGHFDHELAGRMHTAYTRAGGNARLVAFGPFKSDAHSMIGSRDGVRIWLPETERFLASIGMPSAPVIALADDNRFPATGYAEVDNLEAVPFLRDHGREQYRAFLSKTFPRAFAVSPTGAWSWAEEGDDPAAQALANCEKNSSQACHLYAVDNRVVWAPEPAAPVLADTAPATPGQSATQTGSGQQADGVTGR
ncbi:MAG TPA: CocE/NonD family hydrolase [Noviherbaspirillum sp.]|nr:CocE/NonD family hydrolase [Noviherbaspirillum sp.]